ncbi:hypothetical protein FHX74_000390 [Friedmanniella endophytica]|uniref:Phytase-like domain-containing protein n=1 Tax=Microlunatus kandeliicorticis TaxID=1759536 RepID=A0A7W3P4E4_9ACTN|nr:esterase-like activity of phytase family protein [Microlunatus kandeliicorticis]MBA8792796.1 hypothetical protein [Microlunatus kandeliicorticis]
MTSTVIPGRRVARAALAATLAGGAVLSALVGSAAGAGAAPASSGTGPRTSATTGSAPGACPPRALALHYSDALDKKVVDGATIGGLSDIGFDKRLRSYVSSVDNHASDPSRLWFYRDLDHPRVWRKPLVLRKPDGTAWTGETADNEGLAVLNDGRFLVSSEVEPSIRVFGRDGRQRSELPVPARFRVAPAGEATANATLEGLTLSPDGRTAVAAMEGTLSGDLPAGATAGDFRRFLVYQARHGASDRFRLVKQVGYRVDAGLRISEVQEYAPGKLLVMEAAYDPTTGNTIKLYAVTGLNRARDVSRIGNLSTAPSAVMHKTLIADVTACPTLGATAKQPQANPLMDNYEGMTTRPLGGGLYRVALISDDNFNPTQITRVLDLAAALP